MTGRRTRQEIGTTVRVGATLRTPLILAIAALSLVGCGSSDKAEPQVLKDQAQVMQAISLKYQPKAAPQNVSVALGKILNMQVTSPVAGDVTVPGYNVDRRVTAGGTTLLIFSADQAGVFNVILHGQQGDTQIAHLDVKK
jgi:hypothetical protein